MALMDIIKARHSIRKYTDEQIKREDLELAADSGLKSIAFCCISTGVFHFPQKKATEIAMQIVQDYLKEDDRIERVVFNVFKEDYSIYKKLLGYR